MAQTMASNSFMAVHHARASVTMKSVKSRAFTGHKHGLSATSRVANRGRKSVQISALSVGDKIPEDVSLSYFDSDGNMATLNVADVCAGNKVVLFAVPGAFTPTCSLKHLPGFIEQAADIKAKGVEMIGCVAVNDAFVMEAWGKSVGADDKVMMLADGSALFTKALGVELDLTDKGLGIRSRRYSMLIDDGVVKVLNLEEGGAFTMSGAADILSAL